VLKESATLLAYKISQIASKCVETNKKDQQVIFMSSGFSCRDSEYSYKYMKSKIPKVQNNSDYGYAKMIDKVKAGFDPSLIEYPGYKEDALMVAKHLEVRIILIKYF
jgi:hypothetical protein